MADLVVQAQVIEQQLLGVQQLGWQLKRLPDQQLHSEQAQ